MKFTDIFIKRPVMGVAISILLVILGLFGLSRMNTAAYPEIVQAAVNVQVNQTGTSAQSIQSYITSPLESSLASLDNLDYMTSNSSQGSSQLTLYFKAGTDLDNAFNNVLSAVNTAKKTLPTTADDPIITKATAQAINPLYISYTSNDLNSAQLVDYLDRHIKPVFFTVNGVADVQFFSPGLYILITLDPEKIAKYNLSPAVVSQAISSNNLQIAAGSLKSSYRMLVNNVDGTVKNLDQLRDLVVAHRGDQTITLGNIASVSLEAIKGQVSSKIDGKDAVVMTFVVTPNANPLIVVDDLVKKYNSTIVQLLPSYIKSSIVYDGTTAVRSSIHHVVQTVFEAIVIVMIVMILFLGSLKSLIVPVIAIPISIIANFLLLYALGYTVNLITLLAIILAIGLVVDDAIVVLENIHRHIKLGETPFRAAIIGTREIAMPVVVMTFTLAVVFLPIALSQGTTGPIYKEFAITLAGSVIISGLVSLILSPMLVAKLYANYNPTKVGRFELAVERNLNNISFNYSSALDFFLTKKKTALTIIILVFATLIIVPRNVTSELTPVEDRGVIIAFGSSPANSTLKYSQLLEKPIAAKIDAIPEVSERLGVVRPSSIFEIAPLKDNRTRTQLQIVDELNKNKITVPGVQMQAINFPEIQVPGAGFFNFSLAVQSSDDYKKIIPLAQKLLDRAVDQNVLLFGMLNVNYNQSKLNISIDRDKAARFDVPIVSIARSLASYLSGGVAARVSIDDKVYQVITQLPDEDKNSTNSLYNYYVLNNKGQNIPLSELVTYKIESQSSSLPRLNQLNSVSIQGMSLSMSQGELVNWIKANFADIFPNTYDYTLTGDLRSYVEEGNTNNIIFALSFVMIFLVLAMQFDSWRDGLVIMVSVPLAISGCMVTLYICNLLRIPGASFNLYTKIGLMTLVGLITKHGILMCEVAREEQVKHGLSKRQAITTAARLRFRPILMTTLAMIAGLIPLLFSNGTGANARFAIAIIIVSGLAVGTLFTLFILPMVYIYIGKVHKPEPVFDETIPPILAPDEIERNNQHHGNTNNQDKPTVIQG